MDRTKKTFHFLTIHTYYGTNNDSFPQHKLGQWGMTGQIRAVVLAAGFAQEAQKADQIPRRVVAGHLVEKDSQAGRTARQVFEETTYWKNQNPRTDYYTCLHTFFPYNFIIPYV
ncbi:hypothetical protein [Lysinibacillus sp. 3P01SB]|uniref:hypothetical protein n=1 Tax=Lysinibacillus sp. 3P01SB TaxID=3132284 RepID=UPI0039A40258